MIRQLACGLVVAALGGPGWAQDVRLTPDDTGLTLMHNGDTLTEPVDGLARVFKVWVEGADRLFDPKPTSRSWDPDDRLVTLVFDWGRVATRYHVEASRVDCSVEITNTGTAAITSLELFVIPLRLPATRHNMSASAGSLGARLSHPHGAVALVNGTADTVCMVREHFPTAAGGYPIELMTRPGRVSKHPVVDNRWFNETGCTIPAGTTARWACSLHFGPQDAPLPALVPDMVQRQRTARPLTLHWPDRRPIGTVFWAHPNTHWATNPRGYNFGRGEKHDVFTPEGLRAFGDELMQYVDRTIENVKAMNGQGVIVWNLEGEEMWHPASYVGDPAKLPDCAPEMDRYADEVFARFARAGLRTGITIRPTEYFRKAEGLYNWSQRDVRDPVELMAAKIAYAKKRWGCSIFYLDSNVFGNDFEPKLPPDANVPWLMPDHMIEALHERFPDVLIVPEWSSRDYARWSAPYATSHLVGMGSDPLTRLIYPDSFRVVLVSTALMQDHWETFVENVRQGDVLLFPAWYNAPENRLVTLLYAEAKLRRHSRGSGNATPDAAGAGAGRDDESRRYAAAVALRGVQTAEATATLTKLLDDPSPLVRRQSLASLATRERITAPETVAAIMGWLRGRDDPLANAMRSLAATAIARTGDQAVPQVVALLSETKDAAVERGCIQALGASRTQDPEARGALLAILTAEPRRSRDLRVAAIEALGLLRAADAVPALLAELQTQDRDGENERGKAVEALGRIGDPRAIGDLVAYWQRPHTTTVVYWIPDVLDEALRSLTGETNVGGHNGWRQWLERRRQAAAEHGN